MDIEYGAKVIDKNAKNVGTVERVIRDTWTGEVKKFSVNVGGAFDETFYSPEDVLESTNELVKLKVDFNKPSESDITIGAKVISADGMVVGTVDYPIVDAFTGKITKFRVDNGTDEGIFYDDKDVLSATTTEVTLKKTVP